MSMDCLSYLFNWDQPIQLPDCFSSDMDMIIPETDTFFLQPQPQPQPHLQFHQPLFQEDAPSDITHLDAFCHQILPSQENQLLEDSLLPTPKRQKLDTPSYHSSTQNYVSSYNSNLFNPYDLDFVPEPSFFPELQVPDFSLPFNIGRGDDQEDIKKRTLSSQSKAARERRRRIAEKTHELGKLIPGAHKLNTAEMFQAAAKYVKFLQSQVGILQLMQTTNKTQGSYNVEIETCVLLESRAIQEKLSTEEVCLVPSEMVQALRTEESIWRNPKISRKINKLLSTC